jgi:hypothetical protein
LAVAVERVTHSVAPMIVYLGPVSVLPGHGKT